MQQAMCSCGPLAATVLSMQHDRPALHFACSIVQFMGLCLLPPCLVTGGWAG